MFDERCSEIVVGCLCEERSDAAISLLRRKDEIASPFGFAKTGVFDTFTTTVLLPNHSRLASVSLLLAFLYTFYPPSLNAVFNNRGYLPH